MNKSDLDKLIRELQTKEFIVENLGKYTIKRPLSYKEAKKLIEEKLNKGTLKAFFEGE